MNNKEHITKKDLLVIIAVLLAVQLFQLYNEGYL
jgi:hypothetical protein